MKEYHSEKPSITLDLGNGKTRVYYNSIEVVADDNTHWESDYVDVSVLSYDSVVNALIKEVYSVDKELAIHRQRFDKPDEFAEYNDYCERCKAITKSFSL